MGVTSVSMTLVSTDRVWELSPPARGGAGLSDIPHLGGGGSM